MALLPTPRRLTSLLALAGASLLPVLAAAQDAPPATQTATSAWGAGLAVMPRVRPLRDHRTETEVLPVLTYENRWVRVFGPGVELKLGRAGGFAYGLTLGYARDGWKAEDSPALSGMQDRKSSVWLGARARLDTDMGSFSAEWSGDASGNSHGSKLRLAAERRFEAAGLGLTPRLAATWHDAKFVDYYYGVRAAEVAPGRERYAPGGTLNTELAMRLDYRLAPRQMLFADVGVIRLGNAIRHSPVVDRSTVPELRLGWLYRF